MLLQTSKVKVSCFQQNKNQTNAYKLYKGIDSQMIFFQLAHFMQPKNVSPFKQELVRNRYFMQTDSFVIHQ